MSTDDFKKHCREIARRFLLTAVVVDDELSVSADPPVRGKLKEPEGGMRARRAATSPEPDLLPSRSINVDPITRSFAHQGMVCGVVSPKEGQNNHEDIAKAVARADIVILDWQLSRTTHANALPLLTRILREDRPHRLRLIAFYTGDPDHQSIRDQIADGLGALGAPDRAASIGEDGSINFGACRIVVYAKPDSRTVEQSAIVAEEDLADRLIDDFADMVQGLLPSLVLTALAAVRENVHQVLERFGRDLDPAFLAHRACLPLPADSEQQMVEQIASELHGIMDDAVATARPAGIGAIEQWMTDRFGNARVSFSNRHEAAVPKVLEMLKHGLKKRPGPLGLQNYDLLSHGFSGGAGDSRERDRRLAAAMSLRQVPPATWRQLSMGTVVIPTKGDEAAPLLCITPRCDSVRVTDETAFLFLPLTDAEPKTPQVVVPVGGNEHRRMTVSLNPSQWCSVHFVPDADRQCVLAHRDGTDIQPFTFKDASGSEYLWVGELKSEFAQSIAQSIADRMSRVPLNKSEWLRRSERFGPRAS